MKRFLFALILAASLAAVGADKKLSDLTFLTNSSLATDDVFPILDRSASTSKQLQVGEVDKRYFQRGDVIPYLKGGTSLATLGTLNQLLGVNAGASGYEFKTLSGSTNQVTVTQGVGSIVLSTPQNIHTSATPTFAGLTVGSSTGNLRVSSGTLTTGSLALGSEVTGVLPVANGGTSLGTLGTANQLLGVNNGATTHEYKTISGTSNQVTVTHGTNSITLATPQNINTTSSPTFAGLTVGSSTGNLRVSSGALTTGNITLTSEVTGVLPLANGGTANALTAVNGGVVYSNGSSLAISAAGTSNQILQSNGAAAPTFVAGSSLFWNRLGNAGTTAGTDFVGTTDSTALVFKNNSVETMRLTAGGSLGVGTSAPSVMFEVAGSAKIGGTLSFAGSTSGTVAFKAPASAGNILWTLPSQDGTSGQILKTNGSGALGWVANAAGGALTWGWVSANMHGTCSSSPCTLTKTYANGGSLAVTSVTRTGTGAYTFNYSGFSDTPNCHIMAANHTSQIAAYPSTSAFSFTIQNNIGGTQTLADGGFNVICFGPI